MLDDYAESTESAADSSAIAALYPGAPRAVQRALDYIHANLAADLRLVDIAGAARMSLYHFSRTFRKATGRGPHRYVVQARVQRAKDLLDGPLGLAEIAGATGFSDQSHMSKVFRRYTGLSPRQYRASRKGVARCPLQAYFDALRRTAHAG